MAAQDRASRAAEGAANRAAQAAANQVSREDFEMGIFAAKNRVAKNAKEIDKNAAAARKLVFGR